MGGFPATAITPTILPFGRTDDYAPVDQQTFAPISSALVVRLAANDNEGSYLSGLIAGNVGDFHVLCNFAQPIDGGQLTLLDEDSHSAAPNRFNTPDRSGYRIPKNACTFVYYDQNQRWMVLGSGGRAARTIAMSLQLDSYLTTQPITGVVNDWAPLDRDPGDYYQGTGYCINGNTCEFKDNTILRISTLDTTGATLTGMQWLTNNDPAGLGPVKILINYGPGPIVLADEDPRSSLGNQFKLPNNPDGITNQPWTIPYPGSATVWHGSNEPSWQLISASPSTSGRFESVATTTITAQAHNLSPALSPIPFAAGKVNDWNPGVGYASSTVIRATADASGSTVLSGITSVGVNIGDIKIVENFGASMTVSCTDAGSQPQNQFLCAASFTLATYGTMTLRYDDQLSWFVLSHT